MPLYKKQNPIKLVAAWTAILLIAGLGPFVIRCVKVDNVTGYEKNGQRYGITTGLFQGRWYHYYERGLSFAAGKFWQEAEHDYRAAIQQRADDQLRARTYGVHFIEYFPHRELGIALFQQNRYKESIEELEQSLTMEESAKAAFYLDKARKQEILTVAADNVPPRISITSPAPNHLTNARKVRVTGRVQDNTFVKTIQINGENVRIDLSAPEIEFNREILLQNGKNVITVTATDIVGNASQAQHTVNVDRLGPVISFDTPDGEQAATLGKVTIKGYVYDETNLAELRVNGLKISMPVSSEFKLDQRITLLPTQEELVIEARDTLGNQTTARIRIDKKRSMAPSPLLAATNMEMLAETQSGPGRSEEVVLPRDSIKPSIEIDDWEESQSVFLTEAYLAGYAEDNEWVDYLMLNEQNILRHPGKSVFFNSLAALGIGPNTFKFDVWDHSGNQTETIVNIERKIQEIRDIGARMKLVIVPFLRKGSVDRFSAIVEESLLSELEKSNRFQMKSALGLDPKKFRDVNEALGIGRQMGVDYVLTGTLIESEDSIDVYANVYQTDSTEIMRREDVYGEQIDRRMIRNLCRGLVIKLKDAFPLAEGKVMEVQGKKLRLDFSGGQEIVKGMRCILFKEELRLDEQSKRVLDRREIRLASAVITAVTKLSESQTVCEAEIYTGENAKVKQGHLVITQ